MKKFAGVALCLGTIGIAPALSAQDSSIRSAAEAHRAPLLSTLETLVNIDSGTGYIEGLNEVEALLTERLTALEFDIETQPSSELGGNSVIGRRAGSGDRRIMLMAHYDTVFGPGVADERPYRTDEGRAYGPGVGDAKSGVAVLLHTLDILDQLDFDGYGQLTVLFNPDEEKGSFGSRDLIHELAGQQDYVLSFEPSLGQEGVETVTSVTKGINYAFLDVFGRAAHAGVAPDEGRNAIIELSHQLLQLTDLGDPEKGTTLNWTIVNGGTKRNIIPEHAAAEGDMRYFDPSEYDRVLSDVNNIIAETLVKDTRVEFRLDRGRPPLPPNPQTTALAERASAIYKEIGLELSATEIGGGTDAGYAFHPDSEKPVVLESLGLVGGRYHSDEEFVQLDSVMPRLYLATRMIMDLSAAD